MGILPCVPKSIAIIAQIHRGVFGLALTTGIRRGDYIRPVTLRLPYGCPTSRDGQQIVTSEKPPGQRRRGNAAATRMRESVLRAAA